MDVTDDRIIVKALVAFVRENGGFPMRDRFRVEHRSRLSAFDSLEAKRVLVRWHSRTVWTIDALKLVATEDPFAVKALELGQRVFEELKEMYVADLEAEHTVTELMERLGWADPDEVRRSLMLLQHLTAFHRFGVLIPDTPEVFGMTEGVLGSDAAELFRLESALVSVPLKPHEADQAGEPAAKSPAGNGGVRLGSADSDAPDPRAIRERAQAVFEQHFRKLNRGLNLIPDPGIERDALEELARLGLAQKAGGGFKIGPRGIEVCMGEAQLEQVLGLDRKEEFGEDSSVNETTGDAAKVFIIHGRNVAARNAMEQFVRSLGLGYLDFDRVASDLGGTAFVGDIVREGMRRAHGIIALFTADEYGALRPALRASTDKMEEQLRWQSRPNVIFEAGMAYGIAPKRTVLVTLGSDVQLFSDLSGVHFVRLNNAAGSRTSLRQKLIGMKCAVDQRADAWVDPNRSGDFEACIRTGDEGGKPNDPFQQIDPTNVAQGEPREPLDDGETAALLGIMLRTLPAQSTSLTYARIIDMCHPLVSREAIQRMLPVITKESSWSATVGRETVALVYALRAPSTSPRQTGGF